MDNFDELLEAVRAAAHPRKFKEESPLGNLPLISWDDIEIARFGVNIPLVNSTEERVIE